MRLFNGLQNLPPFRNAVLTIGSFDGVHLGHQQIIKKVNDLARSIDGESIAITFHPHPRQIVYPKDDGFKLITTIDEKIQLLEKYGIDNLVVVPFTIEFSQISADEYIFKFLVEKFKPRYIVIGYDHRFGLNRQGDINYLRWHSNADTYQVVEIEKHQVDDMAVSSTKIRQSLESGQVKAANKLLGHYFLLTGTVVHGQKIGTKLGFPTANLEVAYKYKLIPPAGIYAVFVHFQDQRYPAMMYIGKRPTLKHFQNETIEVHIFDFKRDLYGDKLKVELVDWIREDRQFENMDALKGQLQKDAEAARDKLDKALFEESLRPARRNGLPPLVAVVILNYNGKNFLERFLPSVEAAQYAHFKIYVADNGSSDDSLSFMAERYPYIECIDLKGNHGFARGYNLALAKVDAPYYVLLNSDVEVSPDWLDPIIDLMEQDTLIGACQPKIKAIERPDYFEYAGAAGGWLDYLGYPFCRGRLFSVTEKDTGQYDDVQEIFWASGAALVIRGSLYRALGGFDEDYFAHAEEIDLCWRIKRAGFKVMVQPESVVYHVGGGTLSYNTPYKTFLNFRNTLFTLLKNEPLEKLYWLIPLRLLLDGVAGILFLTQGKLAHIRSILAAHGAFYAQFGKMWKKRKPIQEAINKVSIHPTPNEAGRYPGSIIWQYYIRQKRHFKL